MRRILFLLVGAWLALPSSTFASFASEGFVANPTKTSSQSGNWNTGSTWVGGAVPATNEVFVSIANGHTVTIDEGATIQIQTIHVAPGGTLIIGRGVTIITSDLIYRDTSGLNPQFETGIIIEGTVRTASYNATYPARKSWSLISNGSGAGISAGATSMTVADVTGWRVGDQLRFVDTRDIDTNDLTIDTIHDCEARTITGIAGNVVSWSGGLAHAYTTARDHNGTVERFPMVANMSRDIVIRSANPSGTRGHFIVGDAGAFNLDGIAIQDYGRTLNLIDANGNPDFTNNHIGRYPFHVHHSADDSGPIEGTLTRSVIERGKKWGMSIHDSNQKTITWNVVYDVDGWGIGTEDGSEKNNLFEDNLVFMVDGVGDISQNPNGVTGAAYWMTGPLNFLHRNVGANTRAAVFSIWDRFDDTSCGGPCDNDDSLPFKSGTFGRPFEDNEAIAGTDALSIWAFVPTDNVDMRSVVYGFKEWHNTQHGLYAYSLKNVYFINFYSRNDPTMMATRVHGTHNWFGDYAFAQVSFWGCDIQGKNAGIYAPYGQSTPIPGSSERTLLIRDCTFHNNTDVLVYPQTCACGDSGLPEFRVEAIGNIHTNTSGIHYDKGYSGQGNLRNKSRLRVTNYQGVVGDNFEVYASQQASDFIMPQTSSGVWASVDAGKTNAQNQADHGYSVYGVILPGTATTRARIADYVDTFPAAATALSTSLTSGGHTWSLAATANNPGGSTDIPGNDTVLYDGTPTGNRAFGFIEADGRILALGVNARWGVWSGTDFQNWNEQYSNPPGTYTLAPSASGTFLRWDNHATPYSQYVVTPQHEIIIMMEYPNIATNTGEARRLSDSTASIRMSAGGRFLHPTYNWDMNFCSNVLVGQGVDGSLQTYAAEDSTWDGGASLPSCVLSSAKKARARRTLIR